MTRWADHFITYIPQRDPAGQIETFGVSGWARQATRRVYRFVVEPTACSVQAEFVRIAQTGRAALYGCKIEKRRESIVTASAAIVAFGVGGCLAPKYPSARFAFPHRPAWGK
jgi:hypothetical protein